MKKVEDEQSGTCFSHKTHIHTHTHPRILIHKYTHHMCVCACRATHLGA